MTMTTNVNGTRTPGDWAVIETEDGLTINTVREQYDPPIAYVHDEVDAQLFAAAPNLLAIVQRFHKFATVGEPFQYPPGSLQAIESVLAKVDGASAKPPAIGPAVKDVERMCEALTWMGVATSESLEECCFRYDELAKHLVSAVLRNKRRATTEPKAEPLAEYIPFREGDALHPGEYHPQPASEPATSEPRRQRANLLRLSGKAGIQIYSTDCYTLDEARADYLGESGYEAGEQTAEFGFDACTGDELTRFIRTGEPSAYAVEQIHDPNT
jgi:hypothetical protein